MEKSLVTIKTFDNSPEAHLAKNRLEDAGLEVRLVGEDTVGMNWVLSNAFGGIQLLVSPNDVEQAQQLLTPPPTGAPTHELWPPDLEEADDAEPVASDREQHANRAFRGAVMGILFFPLQFYVFWLLLRVFVSDDELRGRYRSRAWWAAAINLPYIFGMCVLLREI